MFRKNKHSAPEQPTQTETAPETDFETYPIENAIRRVTVRRSSGDVEKDWFVVGETADGTRYVVQKFDADSDEVQEKRILKADLDAMQTTVERPAEREVPRRATTDLAGTALRETIPQPQAFSERAAAGWNVPRSELLAAVGQPAAEEKTETADPLAALTEGLSERERMNLRGYAEAVQAKRDAQKAGDGENSTYWGQKAGQYHLGMSKKAQAIADRYEGLYNR